MSLIIKVYYYKNINNNYYIIFNVYLPTKVICLHVCLCTLFVLGGPGGKKRASDLLELKLQIIESLHAGSGN